MFPSNIAPWNDAFRHLRLTGWMADDPAVDAGSSDFDTTERTLAGVTLNRMVPLLMLTWTSSYRCHIGAPPNRQWTYGQQMATQMNGWADGWTDDGNRLLLMWNQPRLVFGLFFFLFPNDLLVSACDVPHLTPGDAILRVHKMLTRTWTCSSLPNLDPTFEPNADLCRMTFIADERFQSFYVENSGVWTLQIKYVQARDAGIYECQVSTEPKISARVHLHVVGKYCLSHHQNVCVCERGRRVHTKANNKHPRHQAPIYVIRCGNEPTRSTVFGILIKVGNYVSIVCLNWANLYGIIFGYDKIAKSLYLWCSWSLESCSRTN